MLENISLKIQEQIGRISDTLFPGNPSSTIITVTIIILSGILLAYWGLKLKKITLLLIGFLVGSISSLIICTKHLELDYPVALFFVLLLGIIGAFLSFSFYYISVVIVGGLAGLAAGMFLTNMLELSLLYSILLIIGLIVICAVLSIKLDKIIFIIATAYLGYLLIRVGLYTVNIIDVPPIFEEIIALIVLITGIIFQFYDNGKKNTSTTNE